MCVCVGGGGCTKGCLFIGAKAKRKTLNFSIFIIQRRKEEKKSKRRVVII